MRELSHTARLRRRCAIFGAIAIPIGALVPVAACGAESNTDVDPGPFPRVEPDAQDFSDRTIDATRDRSARPDSSEDSATDTRADRFDAAVEAEPTRFTATFTVWQREP